MRVTSTASLRANGGARAWTLIELMIAIAIMGIFASIAMIVPVTPMRESEDVLVRERARQWLEYEADCAARGRASDATATTALRALVPGGTIERRSTPSGGVVTVRWHQPSGHREGALSLEVVTP